MQKIFSIQKKNSSRYNGFQGLDFRMLSFLLPLIIFGCNKTYLNPSDSQNLNLKAEKSAVVPTLAANNTPCYWADLLIQNVAEANNIYSTLNSGDIVTWSGINGAKVYYCKTDCSGLIKNLFKQTYGYTDAYFKNWTGLSNPYAVTFYNEIKAKDHFSQISTVNSIVRGDIIAIKYPVTNTNTGHIMLVASAPALRTATAPLVSNTKQYEVTVLDASSTGHGNSDTRYISTGLFNDGIGRGILRLYVNTNGTIAGYTWSTYSNSEYFVSSVRPLIVGRLIP